jgi:hypothetical protein
MMHTNELNERLVALGEHLDGERAVWDPTLSTVQPRVLTRGGIPTDTHHGVWWAAAAAIVVAATVSGTAMLLARRTTESTGTTSPDGAAVVCPVAPQTVGQPSTPVEIHPVSPPVDALLPISAPAGYCVATISIGTNDSPKRYTVWSSCTDCSEPTSSVALVRQGDSPGTTASPEPVHEDLTINGRAVRYTPANEQTPLFDFRSEDGQQPGFSFSGWGLDKQTLIDLATGLINGDDVPVHDGLDLAFDGELGSTWPGMTPADLTVQLSYASAQDNGGLIYSYQHTTTTAPALGALTATMPNARFTSIDGHPAIESTTAQATTLVTRVDEQTTTALTSSADALTVAELTAIRLSPAIPTDPRWSQLSALSSASDAGTTTVTAPTGSG